MSPSHKHARKPVTVTTLERIAAASHSKPLWRTDALSDSLDFLARMLYFDPAELAKSYVEDFGGICVCEMGCGTGIAVRELEEKVPGVRGFGVDLRPKLHRKGLPENRIFEVDLNDMSCIPDGSFHVMFGHNVNTDVTRFIPEMDRVLAPDGLAFFDIENWVFKGGLISTLPQISRLMIARPSIGDISEFDGPFLDFIKQILDGGKEVDMRSHAVNMDLAKFRLIKLP